MDELKASTRLELAASVTRSNRLRDYWALCDLLGNEFFKRAMPRGTYLKIRSALCSYTQYDEDIVFQDPLWHSCYLLEHFMVNAASIAAPVGVSSPDENTVRNKTRTKAVHT